MLLIVNRIYLVKGSVKRLPYLLSLLALFFILVGLRKISGSSESIFNLFLLTAFYFMISYFIISSIVMMTVALTILDLTKNILGLEISTHFIRTLILSFFILGILYPFIVLHIKRLRDARLSYWWTLLTLVPCVQTLFEIFLCFKGSAKKKSKQPKRSSQHKQNKSKPKIKKIEESIKL